MRAALDVAVAHHLRLFLWIVPSAYGLLGIVSLAGNTFNAMHRPVRSLALNTIHLFGLLLPFAFIGSRMHGFPGLLAGVALAHASAGTVAIIMLRSATVKINRM